MPKAKSDSPKPENGTFSMGGLAVAEGPSRPRAGQLVSIAFHRQER